MKNQYVIDGDELVISIIHKGETLETRVSAHHLHKLNELPNTFYVTKTVSGFYVKMDYRRRGLRYCVQLHRYITDAPDGMDVDHKDGNTLNNVDDNLRVVTRSANSQNAKYTSNNNVSGIRGVYLDKKVNRWYGQVAANGKCHSTKRFSNKEDCAKAVEELRKQLHPYATERSYQ
jgi:predicted DNA-binding WGR domain protein